jgi:hypothetical protein
MITPARLMCLMLFTMASWGWCQESEIGAGGEDDRRIQKLIEERKRREELLAREETSLDGGASVNPVLLESITDNSIGIRFEERDAYFRILELAWQTPLAEQEAYAREFRNERRLSNPRYAKRKSDQFPVFIDMFQYPEEYRGRPVSLHGVMRKLTKFDPGKNNRGINEAYEGWVYTDDSQSNPAVVIFLGKPDGLTVGGNLTEEVRLTGYFFKMYGYEAQDVARKAPLVLAGAVEWRKAPKPAKVAFGPEVYLGVTLVVLILGFVAWQGNRREMTSAIQNPNVDFNSFSPPGFPHTKHVAPKDSNLTEHNDS